MNWHTSSSLAHWRTQRTLDDTPPRKLLDPLETTKIKNLDLDHFHISLQSLLRGKPSPPILTDDKPIPIPTLHVLTLAEPTLNISLKTFLLVEILPIHRIHFASPFAPDFLIHLRQEPPEPGNINRGAEIMNSIMGQDNPAAVHHPFPRKQSPWGFGIPLDKLRLSPKEIMYLEGK